MEDRKEIKELLEWNEEQRKVIMDKLKLEPGDLDNIRLWGKWLKYYFSDEIFADYEALKINLDDWLKNIDEDWTEDDAPFGINRAFLLKMYYDDVRENLFMEFLVQYSKGEAKKLLQATPGYIPGEVQAKSYNQRIEHIASCRNKAQAIAKNCIGYIKWLISKKDDEVKKKAFSQYCIIQSSLLRLEILKLCVINVDVTNEPPVDFILKKSTKEDLRDIGEYFLHLKSKAEMIEENKTKGLNKKIDFYSHLFQKTMTRSEIELAFSFFFDGNESEDALRKAYRFLYEYACSMIFMYWMNLRSTLKIVDYALK